MKVNRVALIVSLGFVLFAVSSCRKDREVANYSGDYTLNGRVLDEITGQGIPNATVGVIERSRDATSHLGGKTVAYAKADGNGSFSLKFYVDSKENNYELVASSLGYFSKMYGEDIRFTKNGNKTQDIKLLPEGYLKLLIKGNKGGREIRIVAGGAGISFYEGVDTFRTYNKSPNTNIQFPYWVYFQDTSLNYQKIVDIPPPPPHDTISYLIEF